MPRVFIPPLLRELTGGATEVECEGATVKAIINELDARYAGLADRLRDGDKVASGIAVSIDGVLAAGGLFAPVGAESEVHFLPAISGG